MAESIFWVGRYVERAEGTARILDVVVYQALEQSSSEASAAAARRLLAVMGMPDDEDASLWEVTEQLARDRRSRSSIAGALARGEGEHKSRASRGARRDVGEDQRHVVRAPWPVGGGPDWRVRPSTWRS